MTTCISAARPFAVLNALLACALLPLALGIANADDRQLLAPPTSGDLTVEQQRQIEADPYTRRWRVAQMDNDAVFRASPGTTPLVIRLFSDVEIRARVQSTRALETGSIFLFGTVEGGGHLSLLRHKSGIVQGEIHSAYGSYGLRSVAAGSRNVLIKHLDTSTSPSCGGVKQTTPPAVTTPDAVARRGQVSYQRDGMSRATEVGKYPSTIGIVVLYSQDTEDVAGGPQDLEATIEYDLAFLNQVLENSGLAHRTFHLAALEKTEGPVMDGDRVLDDYRDCSFLNEIALKARAQLVYVYLPRSHRGTGGFADVSVPHGNHLYHDHLDCRNEENYALCVLQAVRTRIRNGCNAGYGMVRQRGVLAHEIGHLFGAVHDREQTGSPRKRTLAGIGGERQRLFTSATGEFFDQRQHLYSRPEVYGHNYFGDGHCQTGHGQCTIMSYCGIKGCGGSTTVPTVPYFSNPDLSYPPPSRYFPGWRAGVPMGVAGEETFDIFGPANVTKIIDQTWDMLAHRLDPLPTHLPDACNAGDIRDDVLKHLPASVRLSSAVQGKSFAVRSSEVEECVDDVVLRVRTPGTGMEESGPYARRPLDDEDRDVIFGEGVQVFGTPLIAWPRAAVFRVSVDEAQTAGMVGRLSFSAREDHYGACSVERRALAVVELADTVEVGWEQIVQKVPGTQRRAMLLQQSSAHSFCEGAPARQLRHLGDFNGDGRADVLLRHADGRWYYYPMNGPNVLAGGGAVSLPRNPRVSVAGVGDFNGDGKDDVLMRLSSGRWRYYPMDGRRIASGRGEVALPKDKAWRIEGIGDFNGDGKDDVVMRRMDGEWHFPHLPSPDSFRPQDHWAYYAMDGRTVLREGLPGLRVSVEPTVSTWFAGVGDFNGDRRDDMLLRRMDGTWHYVPQHLGADGNVGEFAGGGAVALTDDLAWAVAGVADFDGDGKDDILLRHEDGRWRHHLMDGATVRESGGNGELPRDPEVWVAGVGDMDGDGAAELLTRRGHGEWRSYAFNAALGFAPLDTVELAKDSAWGVLKGGVERPPRASTPIPAQPIATDGDATVDLSAYFADDSALTFRATSSDTEVVGVSVAQNVLTLKAMANGRTTVTVTARDADGYFVMQRFRVVVSEAGVAGSEIKDCAACPELVAVPAGTFMMGASEEEAGDSYWEGPVHQVDIPAPFAIGIQEVTFAQWDVCVAAGSCDDYEPSSRHYGEARASRPVADLSWHDAQRYVAWLSAHTGEEYRLPSEAEWEYAARAGTTTAYHFGDTISTEQANYDGAVGGSLPVGSFPANAWGLHDVHGNAMEWTQDCADYANPTYSDAPTDGSAQETGNCVDRRVRGGGWYQGPAAVRSASRGSFPADYRDGGVGLRVVRELGE